MVIISQFLSPEISTALRRDPQGLLSGEWWKIITPLFVHTDGWKQLILNMICIAIIYLLAERLFSWVQSILLYITGGFVGEIAGYLSWDPYEAGASVGFCGLLGGLFILMLSVKAFVNLILCIFLICYCRFDWLKGVI